ncbi:MAG TPA: PQQ-binding-like beta-propeller repeat protein [Bryobacteraceae bacterium]|nr:PQQ-binding-like beta-propeller repeat protein [Bryobacteraceae bacterium]
MYKRRARVDDFGHPISIHPGNAKVNPGALATVEDAREREALPEYQDVPAAAQSELTPALPVNEKNIEWTRSQGDAASSRYSALNQITKENVRNLQVAWTYHSGDGAANIQCTPVIVNGVLYAPTAGNYVVALNAENGNELWRYKPGGHPAQRGLIYWPGNKDLSARLFFTSGASLVALDAKTGQPAAGFGINGRVPSGGMVSPVIYQDVLVAANFNVVGGYDIASGRQLWKYDVLPSLEAKTDDNVDRGANVWGGMAMDTTRGIVYVTTGSPHPNFIGVDHLGQNKGANSVIALEAQTGLQLWSFQEIRHDIWDLDTPAPPNLVTIIHAGKKVDAVAEVTKLGNTLLLDRVTGKPLFGYHLRRAPISKLPGERTWPYQPVFELPQPFARQEFKKSDITDISPQAHAFVEEQVKKANYGWFQPFEPGKPTVYYNVHGGAQWTGAAFDPVKGWLYLNVNEIPWMMTVLRTRVGAEGNKSHTPAPGELAYRQNCAGCHGDNRKGKGMAPSLLGLANRMIDDEAVAIINHGLIAMPPIPVPVDQRQKLIDFLFDRDVPVDNTPATPQTQYTYFPNGYPKLLDDQGYPGSKPPWGTLNAIDLNTGKMVWKVPLGEYEELTRQGVPKTGTENFGGATVTAGGVIFCAGTRDLKIRAFDKDTGGELWSSKLPFGGFAPPATYQVGGRQFVVIAATGGGKLGGHLGDAYVAFALPRP